jgi:hypothetical protein
MPTFHDNYTLSSYSTGAGISGSDGIHYHTTRALCLVTFSARSPGEENGESARRAERTEEAVGQTIGLRRLSTLIFSR